MSNQFVRKPRARTVVVSTPAINSDGIATVPSGVSWQVLGGQFSLATVAVTGTCRPAFSVYAQDTYAMYNFIVPTAFGAGVLGVVTFGVGVAFAEQSVTPWVAISLPPLILLPGDTIYMSFINATGDVQVGNISIAVAETILGY